MRALTIMAPGDARILDQPVPAPRDHEVQIKISYCGICGTDYAIFSGDTSFVRDGLIKYPVRIGHEFSGIVTKVGAGVTGFKRGDPVVGDDVISCMACENCLAGRCHQCLAQYGLGTVNCWDGAFAETIVLPEANVYHLPKGTTLREGALIEPACIAYTGVTRCDIRPDSRALVIGTGCIGLSAVAIIKALCGATVYLSGRTDMKLDRGREMGADAVINVKKENLSERIRQLTDGAGLDVIIEASGNIEVLNDCLYLLREHGQIALIGFFEEDLNGFNIDRLVLRQIRMTGVAGGFGTPRYVLRLLEEGRLSLLPLITQEIPLKELPDMLRDYQNGSPTMIKALVAL